MEKIKFLIRNVEADWPPVKHESLWGERNGDSFKLKNAPFFIDNVAFDDIVQIKKLDGDVFDIIKVINPSQHSTIWIYINDDKDVSLILEAIKKLNCGVEGGAVDNYYSINIPSSATLAKLYVLLDPYIGDERIIIDYPCLKNTDLADVKSDETND
ncbi:MAG: DUF4265 domain-containing protein [Algicola sp.]|nr:DUF4265 domain-containing protein [Algicola sp.]